MSPYKAELVGSGQQVTFADKPAPEVLCLLKGWGLRWDAGVRTWFKRGSKGFADMCAGLDKLLGAKRLFPCRMCGLPNGHVHSYAARTLILCTACYRTWREQHACR